MSKSEIVVPKLHVPGARMKRYIAKEEDPTTYTSSHADKFAYGMEVEETDEVSIEAAKKDSISEEEESTVRESSTVISVLDGEDNCSCSVLSKVQYFENYSKKVCYYYVHLLLLVQLGNCWTNGHP